MPVKKRQVVFKKFRRQQCPACLDRNALNLVGLPIFWQGMKLTGGCELCDGTGRVEVTEKVEDYPPGDVWIVHRECLYCKSKTNRHRKGCKKRPPE